MARAIEPVAEIQFFDYIWAMMQLRKRTARNSVAFERRVQGASGVRGSDCGFSQGELPQPIGGVFHHIPGLRVVMRQRADLLRLWPDSGATNPVLFLEHKHLRQPYNRSLSRTSRSVGRGAWSRKVRVSIITYAVVNPAKLRRRNSNARRLGGNHRSPFAIAFDWEAIAATCVRQPYRRRMRTPLSWG